METKLSSPGPFARTRSALKLPVASVDKKKEDAKKDVPPFNWQEAATEVVAWYRAVPAGTKLADVNLEFLAWLQSDVPTVHWPIIMKVWTQLQLDYGIISRHRGVDWTAATCYTVENGGEPAVGDPVKTQARGAILLQSIQMYPHESRGKSNRKFGGNKGKSEGKEQPKKA
jgi:hypothetical protein